MSTEKVAFASDQDSDGEYSQLSNTAVLALLAGLMSPLCLLFPAFLIVPVAAIVFSLIALLSISRNRPRLTGRMPATLGLLLALLTGSAAVGHLVAARQMVRDQTCDFANRWVELTTSGQIEEAFLWTMSVRERPRREVPAKAFVTSNKTLQQALVETFGKSPLQEMTKRGKPKISYHGVITSYGPNHDRVVVHEYHLEFEKGEPKRLEIAIAVNRQIDADEKVRFVVFDVTNVDDLILR